MNTKKIFIFEAEDGMTLANNAVLPDGHIVSPAGTVLTFDLIRRISDYHILEIDVLDTPENSDLNENDNPTYYEKVKQSDSFKVFNDKYLSSVSSIKNNLNSIIYSSTPVNKELLLSYVNDLLSESKNSIRLFDMLHSMREYDDITFVHSINVSLICSIIGQWLGCDEEEIEMLALSGLLHDIGKILVPNDIIFKPSKLDYKEFDVVKTHVSLGYEKLKPQSIDTKVKEACLLHHERCDGSGYPFGLKSDKIPFPAKIVAIADVYDAMTSSRIYRNSICPFDVIRDMEASAFDLFDPTYLLPFLNNVVSTYLHNNVRLSNGQIGEVIMINKNDLSRPTIKCDEEYIDLSKRHDILIEAIL